MGIFKWLWQIVWGAVTDLIRILLILIMVGCGLLAGVKLFEAEVREFIQGSLTPAYLQQHSKIGYGTDPPVLYRLPHTDWGKSNRIADGTELKLSYPVYKMRL